MIKIFIFRYLHIKLAICTTLLELNHICQNVEYRIGIKQFIIQKLQLVASIRLTVMEMFIWCKSNIYFVNISRFILMRPSFRSILNKFIPSNIYKKLQIVIDSADLKCIYERNVLLVFTVDNILLLFIGYLIATFTNQFLLLQSWNIFFVRTSSKKLEDGISIPWWIYRSAFQQMVAAHCHCWARLGPFPLLWSPLGSSFA